MSNQRQPSLLICLSNLLFGSLLRVRAHINIPFPCNTLATVSSILMWKSKPGTSGATAVTEGAHHERSFIYF